MDQSELKAPTSGKTPTFRLAGKRGAVLIPYIKGMDKAQAVAEAKNSSTPVTSRTAAYTAALVAVIADNLGEFKSEPKKDNAAGKAIAEVEQEIFGKGQPTDPVWRTVKSAYLAYYREHAEVRKGPDGETVDGPPWQEVEGQRWIMPLRAVQAVRSDKERKTPEEIFSERVENFVELGITKDGAQSRIDACERAMALLGKHRDMAVEVREGRLEPVGKVTTEAEAKDAFVLGGYKKQH